MEKFMIETHDLTKRYGNQASVSHLNIHVKKGRIYGLLGRNGAGKTTTMKMLLNFERGRSFADAFDCGSPGLDIQKSGASGSKTNTK